ncbi:hypothetical protein N7495_009990 [Penicillium taxi]|uniref:uncharacterized protein n=1 Tax=Penicillium taxi TaxID=168475 RepID=UPI00254561E4|nr:uncharacterized protein N7495_009990 [Penicillium taxi]KAJ5885480.1 hypothetical protein N7495_009990 [Penicillium taxi]
MQPPLAPAPHPNMQNAQDPADQVLHDQLLAAQHNLQSRPQVPGQQQHMQANNANTREQANIDPAISGAAMMSAPQPPVQFKQASPEDGSPKAYGGGKRELSTSKRAAQNRAAQRAFRQRKESYIRKLEEDNKDLELLRENLQKSYTENYQLREHIITLQTRLMEVQVEVPDLPANIDLSQPRHGLALAAAGINVGASGAIAPNPTGPQQAQHPGSDDLNRLAVAGLGMRKHEETNFLTNSFQQNKRARTDDVQGDNTDPSIKVDGHHHGLPLA